MPYFVFDQIKIGPLTIYTWGLMVGLGFLLAAFLFFWQAKKKGIDERKILGLIVFVFLGAIFGSRFFYILGRPLDYLINPAEILKLSQGGMTFYGGFLFALAVGWLYIKKHKLNFWQMADMAALSLPLAMFLGRLGCFLINDHQGTLTNLAWGIIWPDGTIRHPIALYLSLAGLLIFLVLWRVRVKIKEEGQLFLLFLFLQAGSRLGLDFLRADDPRYFALTASQWVAPLIIVLALFAFLRRTRANSRRV